MNFRHHDALDATRVRNRADENLAVNTERRRGQTYRIHIKMKHTRSNASPVLQEPSTMRIHLPLILVDLVRGVVILRLQITRAERYSPD